MAQLQSIISSVLRDVLVAQHEANIYSMSLCESYRKDGHTELFPLPAIAIGEMELEIRYGIKAVAAQSIQFEINYPCCGRLCGNSPRNWQKSCWKV